MFRENPGRRQLVHMEKGIVWGGEAWEALPHQGPTRKPIVDNRSPRHKKPLPHVCVVHEAVVKAQ